MPRGGRRPGAGAPKGNTNAMTHGLNSPRLHKAVFLIALFPELRAYIRALFRTDARKAQLRYEQLVEIAANVLSEDTALTETIKRLLYFRLVSLPDQLQILPPLEHLKTELSNNQQFTPITEELAARHAFANAAPLSPDLELFVHLLSGDHRGIKRTPSPRKRKGGQR